MNTRNIITTAFIIGVIALMFIPIGLSTVNSYDGSTSSSSSTDTYYVKVDISQGGYSGSFNKDILFVKEDTVGGTATYYPMNVSGKQTVQSLGNGVYGVSCGTVRISVTGSDGLPAYRFLMTLESAQSSVNCQLYVKCTVGNSNTIVPLNTLVGTYWDMPANTSTINIQLFAVVPTSTDVEPIGHALEDAVFGFKAEVTAA